MNCHTKHLLTCKLTGTKYIINMSQVGTGAMLNLCLEFHRLYKDLNNKSRFERM